jgi:gamma-glutamyltranspeptidase/glutathione hydrolase
MRHWLLFVLVVAVSPTPSGFAADRPIGQSFATRSVVRAQHGMVAAAQPLAVQVGVDILKQGGSAVDAAIAVNACLGLMEPTANGLGGDLFAIVYDPKTKRLHGLNASGRAPLALTIDKVKPLPDGTIPLYSPFSWTVPGCADGWFELHKRFGRLPMKDVLAPAIAYARNGFPLSPVIAADWGRAARLLKDKPGFAEVFMPGGRAPAEGEIFRNPALARTLERLAQGGRDAFYRGPVADALVRYSQQNQGYFSKEDFARHTSTWDEPISTDYRGYTVWELPPNGQGLAALQMLNLLENFDLKAMGRESADFWHVLVEAKKLAFADRARYYADPAFASVPVRELLSKDYARARAKRIDMAHAAGTDEPGNPRLSMSETTCLATGDQDGMMVALIQSNYTGFGSGYVVPELGFGLQDRGGLFSLDPKHPNRLEPGKRPFHTIIPAFITKDGVPLMAFALMGGDMQPQGHVQIVVDLVDLGMGLQEAGDAPRFHHDGSSEPTGTVMHDGGELHLEDGVPMEVRRELARRGHRIAAVFGVFGGYQAVWRDPATGVYAGASESRKDGCAMGY